MNLDHVSFAAQQDGLHATADRLAEQLGITYYDGGIHPRFGTRNLIFPLANGHYLEVVEALEHPAALATPFGQAARARSDKGGGWMAWCVSVNNLAKVEDRLERKAVDGNRTPEGSEEIHWKQIGVKGVIADGQLPYFIHWVSPAELHPSARPQRKLDGRGELTGDDAVAIESLQIAGSRDRVRDWLGTDAHKPIPEIGIDWVAPHGEPGIMSVTFTTPQGRVVL